MSTNIENVSKEQLSRFLPDALHKAIASYQTFMDRKIGSEPKEGDKDVVRDIAKDFAAHHAACKAAIAHIELLLKFARWADLPDPKIADRNNQIVLAAIMQEAEEELQKYRTEGGDDE